MTETVKTPEKPTNKEEMIQWLKNNPEAHAEIKAILNPNEPTKGSNNSDNTQKATSIEKGEAGLNLDPNANQVHGPNFEKSEESENNGSFSDEDL